MGDNGYQAEAHDPRRALETFNPAMPDCPIRAKVSSTGYGSGGYSPGPKAPRERTWEPAPTFKPEVNKKNKLYNTASSSGYGTKAVPVTPVKQIKAAAAAPRPMSAPSGGALPRRVDKIKKQAASSSYGKQTASPKKKLDRAPLPSFKPVLNPLSQKLATETSGYGKKSVAPRPQTAPPRERQFQNDAVAHSVQLAATAHLHPPSLLLDPASKGETTLAEPQTGGGLVLDCVALAAQNCGMRIAKVEFPPPIKMEGRNEGIESTGYGTKPVPSTATIPERSAPTPPLAFNPVSMMHRPASAVLTGPAKTELADKVQSSGYGGTMPTTPKPWKEGGGALTPEQRWQAGRAVPIEKLIPEQCPPKTPMADKVESTKYGVVPPPVGEMLYIQPTPVFYGAVCHKGQTGALQVFPPPPPAPRNELTDKVGSHAYGSVSPVKEPRGELEPEPVWVPPDLVTRPLPEPRPFPVAAAVAYQHVPSTGYGSRYNPATYVPHHLRAFAATHNMEDSEEY